MHTRLKPSQVHEPFLNAEWPHFRGSPKKRSASRIPNITYTAYSGKTNRSSKIVLFVEDPWFCCSEATYPVIASPIVFISITAFRLSAMGTRTFSASDKVEGEWDRHLVDPRSSHSNLRQVFVNRTSLKKGFFGSTGADHSGFSIR